MTFTLERPARLLLLSNAATIAIALLDGWTASEVMWVYWFQSVAIGFFNVLRILRLGGLPPGGAGRGGPGDAPARTTSWSSAVFFAVHYGFFHFGYFIFLAAGGGVPGALDLLLLGICAGGFLVNHAVSYRENVEDDLRRRPRVESVMFYPYLRIIPMHVTIIFGGTLAGGSTWALLLFLSLKTAADLAMHLVEHGKLAIAMRRGG